jgi:hypothetical protein
MDRGWRPDHLVLPAAQRASMQPPSQSSPDLQRCPIAAWFSLTLLVGTGLFQ